jgi:alkane 1-monooxygenase
MKPADTSVALFALATLAPVPLFALGLAYGGVWAASGLFYMTLLIAAFDHLSTRAQPGGDSAPEFPAADPLLLLLSACHFVLFPLAVWGLGTSESLSLLAKILLFSGIGLWFGQVINPCAHELIHRTNRWLFWLGAVLYSTVLFGHHTSAHRLVHHRFAASPQDPNSARGGEGFYRFALRAWAGSYRTGLRAETARQIKGLHPYLAYSLIAAGCLILGYLLAGWLGVSLWLGLALHAQTQLLLADYVQHYGLYRSTRPDGKLEPVSDRHSWNAPHRFSAHMMLNAPRHSDHHARPAQPYPALRLPAASEAPMLPHSLPVCCVIALIPPLWRRMMHPRLAAWRHQIAQART